MENNKTFVLTTLYHNPVVVIHTHGSVSQSACMVPMKDLGGQGGGGGGRLSTVNSPLHNLSIYIATSVSRTANT